MLPKSTCVQPPEPPMHRYSDLSLWGRLPSALSKPDDSSSQQTQRENTSGQQRKLYDLRRRHRRMLRTLRRGRCLRVMISPST